MNKYIVLCIFLYSVELISMQNVLHNTSGFNQFFSIMKQLAGNNQESAIVPDKNQFKLPPDSKEENNQSAIQHQQNQDYTLTPPSEDTTDSTKTNAQPTVIVNNYIQLKQQTAQQNTQTQINQQEQNMQQENQIYNTLTFYGQHGLDSLWQYKYSILGIATLCTYLSTVYRLVSMYLFLCNTTRWANWQYQLNIEELASQDQQLLCKQLLHDIQVRYMNEQNPTDSVTPLTQFIQDTNKEHAIIERYLSITRWLYHFYLLPFFPTNYKKIAFVQGRARRLKFIRTLFTNWSATYNVTHISPQSVTVKV